MKRLTHRFVKQIPSEIEEGVVYVSVEYATVIHKCCCGCGSEVVTPLSPRAWKFTFDGESITLYPSIGNWSFPCLSHYWIEENSVKWAPKWSKKQIDAVREHNSDEGRKHLMAKSRGLRSLFRGLRKQ